MTTRRSHPQLAWVSRFPVVRTLSGDDGEDSAGPELVPVDVVVVAAVCEHLFGLATGASGLAPDW